MSLQCSTTARLVSFSIEVEEIIIIASRSVRVRVGVSAFIFCMCTFALMCGIVSFYRKQTNIPLLMPNNPQNKPTTLHPPTLVQLWDASSYVSWNAVRVINAMSLLQTTHHDVCLLLCYICLPMFSCVYLCLSNEMCV